MGSYWSCRYQQSDVDRLITQLELSGQRDLRLQIYNGGLPPHLMRKYLDVVEHVPAPLSPSW